MSGRAFLIGVDNAISGILAEVDKWLSEAGVETDTFIAYGDVESTKRYDANDIEKRVSGSDVVIIGVSSSEERAYLELVALKRAVYMCKRTAAICDVSLAFQRPWLIDLVTNGYGSDLLFVTSPKEVEMARAIYPVKTRVGVFNPFGKWFFVDRDEVMKGEIRQSLGIDNDKDIILVSTDKEIGLTIVMLSEILEATFGLDVNVVISLNSGLGNNTVEVAQVVNYLTKGMKNGKVIQTELSSTKILPAAKLLVCVAGSTLGAIGSCLRVPVISPRGRIFAGSLIKKVGISKWPLAESGANLFINLSAYLINDLLNEKNYDVPVSLIAQMLKAQEREFPRPDKPGQAVENVVREILALMG